MKFGREAVLGILLAGLAFGTVAQEGGLVKVTVTGTREVQSLDQTPASIGVVSEESIKLTNPGHPSQILSQVPGVAAAVTNGEGHTTSIRQPFTTNPVYLFLEDGIPIQSTGFFNHNSLYIVNLPQAGGIEVNRGPSTALYGSDAIGGVVNILTRKTPKRDEFSVFGEAGSFGWRRILAGGGIARSADKFRADLNLTRTDGWREQTAYQRQSANLRWDHAIDGNSSLRTQFAYTHVDQETGANSPLIMSDYLDNPTRNYKPIAFRRVGALRLSTSYEHEQGDTLISMTPYYRDNSMDLLASFSLASDPTVYNTQHRSYGLQGKWRRNFPQLKARLIAGVDVDVSPGARTEDRLNLTTSGTGASRPYTAYSTGARVYDYDVTFRGVSPYLHGEITPSESLHLTAGVRYDRVGYRFENHIGAASVMATSAYGQSANTSIDYNHVSPKFGLVWDVAPRTHAFVSFNHGFRAPSESQLFRPSNDTTAAKAIAAAASALTLKPVTADQAEVGLRGRTGGINFDLVYYSLRKRDDILTYTDPVTNIKSGSNNGSTRHRGMELALNIPLDKAWLVDVALMKAKHHYSSWIVPGGANFSGFEIESAPRSLANTRLTWTPADATQVQLEWLHMGSYWMDQANTTKYAGHELLNLRAIMPIAKDLKLSGSIANLADKRYADSSQISSAVAVLSPGMPRSYTLGLEAKW